MTLEQELDVMEDMPQTQAEQIDQETEIQDVEDDVDEILGPEAMESDQERAFDSFITDNESDYDGFDADDQGANESDDLADEGYSIEDDHELEIEAIEMEIEEGDIYAYLFDEDDNEIGFVLIDEDGNEQEYYYVDMDEYEIVEEAVEDDDEGTRVVRAGDGEEFDLGITREGIAEATSDINAIYKDGKEIAAELKDTFSDISEGLNFLKK